MYIDASTIITAASVVGGLGVLQGLIESGCNGPCKDALGKLDKHLNQKAHTSSTEV